LGPDVPSRPVSAIEWVLVAAASIVAPVHWASVWRDSETLRRVTKPSVLALLTLAAISATADDGTVQVVVVLALLVSLAGDVALMDEDYFIVGLACFLLAHVLYTVAVLSSPDWAPARAAVGGALAIVVLFALGSRLDRSLGAQPAALRFGVRVYIVVILTMLVVAWSAGPALMAIGAAFFVASDSLLGWNRFVDEDRRLQMAVMPTYHIGQALMALALLHQVH
jgi:uncharacterized membrane protein YhhN